MAAVKFNIEGATPVSFSLEVEDQFVPTLKSVAELATFASSKPGFNFQAFVKALMQVVAIAPQVIAAFEPAFNLTALLAVMPAAIAAFQALIAAITG